MEISFRLNFFQNYQKVVGHDLLYVEILELELGIIFVVIPSRACLTVRYKIEIRLRAV